MNKQFYEHETWHSLQNLHLDNAGKPDKKHGAFYDIERIYHIIPKEGSVVMELAKLKTAKAAAKAARKAAANVMEVQPPSKRGDVKFNIGDRVVAEFLHGGRLTEFAGEVKEINDYNRYTVEFDDGDRQRVFGNKLTMQQ